MVKTMFDQTSKDQFSGYLWGTSIGKVSSGERLKGSNLTNIHIVSSDDLVLCYHHENNELGEAVEIKYYFTNEKLCGGEVDMKVDEENAHFAETMEKTMGEMIEDSQGKMKEAMAAGIHQFFSDGKDAGDKFYTSSQGELMISMLCMHSEEGEIIKISMNESNSMH